MALSVLMIDAEQPFANDVAQQLGERGMQVEVLGDGKQGLEKARSLDAKPDLIVLCVELPKMSGYSICNKLKKDDNLREIPLIITSSEATPETFEQHKRLKTRADGYLIKPFVQDQIIEEIQKLIPDAGGDDEGVLDLGDDDVEAGESFDLSGFADDIGGDDDLSVLEDGDDDLNLDDIADLGEGDGDFNLDGVAEDDALSALGEDAVDALAEMAIEDDDDVESLDALDDDDDEALDPDEDDDPLQALDAIEALETMAPLSLNEDVEEEAQKQEPDKGTKPETSKGAAVATSMSPAAKAEHEKHVRELRRQNSDLQARVAELETRLKASEEEARKKTEDLSNVQSSSSSSQRELLDLKQKLHEKEKELFALKEDAFSQERAAFDASEKLAEVQRESDEFSAQLADRDAKIATLESKVSSITEERNSIEQESQTQVAELESQVAALISERDGIQAEAKGVQEGLEQRLAAAEKLAADRGDRVDTLTSELADKEEQISDMYQKGQHDQDIRERALKAVQIANSLLDGELEGEADTGSAELSL